MRKDVDTMKKDDLMRYARELGVETCQPRERTIIGARWVM
jgi:hypothetical protein